MVVATTSAPMQLNCDRIIPQSYEVIARCCLISGRCEWSVGRPVAGSFVLYAMGLQGRAVRFFSVYGV